MCVNCFLVVDFLGVYGEEKFGNLIVVKMMEKEIWYYFFLRKVIFYITFKEKNLKFIMLGLGLWLVL